MKMLVPRLSRQHCIYAKLSARVGSISDNKLGGWYSYRSSKAAFNMMLQTAAIEHHRVNQKAIFVALQPGTVASALSKPFVEASQALSAKDSVDQMLKAIYQLEPKSDAHFVDYKGETIYW
jgi:NAD(P)-dependent dehydrogenase (short-subunit alcohol dehydrogenase family)